MEKHVSLGKNVNYRSIAVTGLLILFVHCVSTPIRSPKKVPDDLTPVKVVIVSDGVIYSKPAPRIIDGSSAQGIVAQLGYAAEKRLEKEVKIEVVGRIDLVGMGLDHTERYTIQKDELSGIDNLSPPFYTSRKIDSMKTPVAELLRETSWIAYRKLLYYDASISLADYFSEDSVQGKLAGLKELTGADYCLFTTMYGDIRRKPVPVGVKVATAVATGVASILSPIGGIILIPGDETTFQTKSYLFNLSTGRVKWTRAYNKYELYAVEGLRSDDWAYAVFKKFPRERL